MSMRCVEDESWGIGNCENPRCGKEGVYLYPITTWDSARPERFRTFEICGSCSGVFHRGELEFDGMRSEREPGAPS